MDRTIAFRTMDRRRLTEFLVELDIAASKVSKPMIQNVFQTK